MAYVDRISMCVLYIWSAQVRFLARARALDLALPPRETPGRYASMAQKEAVGGSVRAYEALSNADV